jgi:two-component system LytT family response regulator
VPAEDIALFTKEEIIYLVNREGKKFITDYRSLDEVQELVDPKTFTGPTGKHSYTCLL